MTCLACGRVSIGITQAEAEAAVARVNAQMMLGEPIVGLAYFRCCPTPRYRPARLGDVPDGCTIAYVLAEGFID